MVVESSTEKSEARGPLFFTSVVREQIRAALLEADELANRVDLQPAQRNRIIEPSRYSAGVPLASNRNPPIAARLL
jgi:hypothetical protein